MSLLNKFIAPELKIKPKGAKGRSSGKGKPGSSKYTKTDVTAAAKAGLNGNLVFGKADLIPSGGGSPPKGG